MKQLFLITILAITISGCGTTFSVGQNPRALQIVQCPPIEPEIECRDFDYDTPPTKFEHYSCWAAYHETVRLYRQCEKIAEQFNSSRQ